MQMEIKEVARIAPSPGCKLKHSVCQNPGLNQGPLDLQSNTLPAELFRPLSSRWANGVVMH